MPGIRSISIKMVSLMVLLAVSISIRAAHAAQKEGSIAGVVTDNSGQPAAGAFVKARNAERRFAVTVTSQERGRYQIPNLPPGKYSVQGTGGGFQSDPGTSVELDGSLTAVQNLSLTIPQDFRKALSVSQSAALLPEGEGKTIVMNVCLGCHATGLYEILSARKSRDAWAETLEKMRNHPYGHDTSANFSDKQKSSLLDYLPKYFGPEAPPFDSKANVPKTWVRGAAAMSIVTEIDLPAGSHARDIVVDTKGTAWVGESGHGAIARIDPSTLAYSRFPLPGGKSSPTSLEIDAQDRIWMGDAPNKRLVQYDTKSGDFTVYPLPDPPHGGTGTNSIRIASDGAVWVTEQFAQQILRLDPATKKVTAFPVPTAVLTKTDVDPYGIAIDPNQFVWFAERYSSKVGKVEPKTGEIAEFNVPTPGGQLKRMATDAEGNIWFTEYGGGGKLAMIDYRTGKFTEFPTPTKESGPYSVDVDRKRNRIWVNEIFSDQIARYDPRTKTFVEYLIPTVNADVRRISLDPSRPDRVWFAERDLDKVGYLDVIE